MRGRGAQEGVVCAAGANHGHIGFARLRAPGSNMARVVIPIYFDYASTLCYVAWRIVREIEDELGFEALWKGVPISLRDFRTRGGRNLTEAERHKVMLVAAETGVPVVPPENWLDSRDALEGAELAREAGVFERYHEAVFRGAFEERLDIGRPEVLDAIAERAGMDRGRFRTDLASRRMAHRLEQWRREADEFSALGYPTFMLGDFPMTGIQPAETMRMLLGRFIRQRQAEPQA
jgi:predicted DsbA family dithiol-disulfide isomerase